MSNFSLYDAPYIKRIRNAVRIRHSRSELRTLFWKGTGLSVPKDVNLRTFVSKWHAHQQAINAGAKPSKFWLKANNL